MNPASRPRTVSDETLAKLKRASTATLTSALKTVSGISTAFMHNVSPLRPGCKMAGPAYTFRYIPARADLESRADLPHGGIADSIAEPVEFNRTDPQRIAVESVQEGDVFVIDARGETRCGTMGAILATRMCIRGVAGIVTDGCYRDSPEIAALGEEFPHFSAYASAMNAQTNKTYHHPLEIQTPIACGGVAVVPGDIIVGDDEGIIVIPAAFAERVADLALEHELHEEYIMARLREGASIVGLYPPSEETDAKMEAWVKARHPEYGGRDAGGVFKAPNAKL